MSSTVSVAAIIPTYNCARFLPEAVASVRSQTLPVAEIIIVDDGSTDDTAAVVAGLGPDIHYLQQRNAGPSSARNAGAEAATADWVAFLDADDVWLPEKTARQLALLESYPDLALVATNRMEIDGDGEVLVESLFERHGLKDFFEGLDGRPIPDALTRLVRKNFIPTSSVLMQRQAMLDCGGFNTAIRFSEDLELWARIAARHPIACLPEVQTLYRRHGANAVDKSELMLQGAIETMQSLRVHCGDALRLQHGDPDRLVAEHQSALGYFYFDQGRSAEARKILRQSLAEKLTRRALVYLLAACLPRQAVRAGRGLKQALSGS